MFYITCSSCKLHATVTKQKHDELLSEKVLQDVLVQCYKDLQMFGAQKLGYAFNRSRFKF